MVAGPQEGTGPTWADVQDTVSIIEGESGLQVVFKVRFYKAGKLGARNASVVAEACRGAGARAETVAWGWHDFRGPSGAKTMPAAMYMALLRLQDKLDDRADSAAQLAAF